MAGTINRPYAARMAVRFSSIHAALGVVGPLDHGMVAQAIAEGLVEDDHLDWKRELPSDGDEAAKDVAALANGRGGMLVYGVAENRQTSAATKAMPVPLGEREQRRIRSWFDTRIQPMIVGIEFVALPADPGGDEGFLVIVVPESPGAPHAVRKDDALWFPYRVGTQTFWMREWDLERAYRERFARQASDETRLSDMVENVVDYLDPNGCWLIGAARQTVPVSAIVVPPDRNAIVKTVHEAADIYHEIAENASRSLNFLDRLGNSLLNPKVGLRRWVIATRGDVSPGGVSDSVQIDIHHDGSVLFAVNIDGYHSIEGKHALVDFLLTGFAASFVALTQAVARSVGQVGGAIMRVDLFRRNPKPVAFVALERRYTLEQPHWTRDVQRFLPVSTVAPRADKPVQMREIATAVISDVSSQFGYPGQDIQW